jgi:putative flippase GtrA
MPSDDSVPQPEGADSPGAGPDPAGGFLNNPHIRQFIKFCIVGASSSAVMFAILNLCHYVLHLGLFQSLTAAFLLSVANGFVWNRRWTFKKARGNAAHDQGVKFLAVNIVGYVLNTTIVVLIVAHFSAPGAPIMTVFEHIISGTGKAVYPKLVVNGAQAGAICIVVWWNYFANRFWAFKH